MEKGNKQAFKIGGKVVSKNRFDELVSSYLDMTITKEELDLLAKLVSSNERAKNDFSKARLPCPWPSAQNEKSRRL